MIGSILRAPLRERTRAAAVVLLAGSFPLGACSSSSPADAVSGDAALGPIDSGRNDDAAKGGSGGSSDDSGVNMVMDSGPGSDTGGGSGGVGDAGGDAGGDGAPRDPAYNGIYVPNGQSVKVFALSARGSVAPIRTLSGTSTMLATALVAAVNSVGQLFVANEDKFGYVSTLVYPRLANGNVAPLRTVGVSGGMSGYPIVGLAIGENDDLWGAQYNVYHFPANATTTNGAIASGPNLASIAVSAAGEVLVATSDGIVATYASSIDVTDASTPSPIRTLVTGKTLRSIAIANDTIFVLPSTGDIVEYAATASGKAAAAATIASPTTALQNANTIAIDAASSPPVLYIAANDATSGIVYGVPLVGSPPAYAASSPTSIAGPLTNLTSATSVCVVHY